MRFYESFDVIVDGFGHGCAISAITAADNGAKTLIIEQSKVPGGLSICSYGAVRSARDRNVAINYLKATGFKLGLLVNFGHYPRLEWERLANTNLFKPDDSFTL